MFNLYKPKELFIIALILFSFLLITTPQTFSQTAIQFDGTNDYVTFGTASALGTSTFTLEAWIKKTGAGLTTSTGTGGVTAVPIIAKGRGEAETPANLNCNYFLGLNATSNITADFEDKATGLNHPITGTATLSNNVWYHIAATYDGTTWRLFLNGNLEASLVVGAFLPENTSIQHAGLGTALTSTGVAAGYFAGIIEEPRVWNYARSQVEIQSCMGIEMTSGTGLLGRWGLNNGTGTTATNSIAGSPNGNLTNGPTWITGISFPTELWALQFDGTNDYITFGQATSTLGASTFTLECWFKRTGTGTTGTTGSGGIENTAIPLITKGRNESDGSDVDMNYWLGIDNATGQLAADFEDFATGANHPVRSTSTISLNIWYHAAAIYDGTTWKLYLNGNLEQTLAVNQTPRYDSRQHAALGSALNTGGTAAGFFAGVIDEARIWNVARTQQQILDNINLEITSGTGLIGRWALDNGTGNTTTNSIGGSPNGTLTNGPLWVFGAPFNFIVTPPAAPTNLNATPISHGQITLSWTDNSSGAATFEIIRSVSGGSFNQLTTLPANSTYYNDLNLVPSTEYCYQIRAVNIVGPSAYAGPQCATTTAEGEDAALEFNGSDQYVTFGSAPELGASAFTLECWVKRTAGGMTMTTGTNGLDGSGGRPLAYPVLTKGMGEGESPANINTNYFLGITSTEVIGADFEDNTNGTNHPVWGTTTIPIGEWHHIAASYNGSTWMLFLDGNSETLNAAAVQSPNQTPESSSIQHAALGAGIGSLGQLATGHFAGLIDEARIWNYARSQSEILGGLYLEIKSGTGLLGRWGLNEGTGSFVNNSIFANAYGTLVNNPVWVDGGTPLPVELASFEGKVLGNKVNLNWRTETEVNNYGFEVQRQTQDTQEWKIIGFVNGNGNSNSPKNYSFSDADIIGANKLAYRLKQIDNDGKYEYSDIIELSLLPSEYELYQNYPNPFNPNTKIRFSVIQDNLVSISLYTILGEKVRNIVYQNYSAGSHEVTFNSSNLPSGVYIYKIEIGENGSAFTSNKKMTLIK